MTFERKNIGFFLAFLMIGGILGSAVGTLISRLIPAVSIIKTNLTGPIGFNLEIISFYVNINLASIIGFIIGIIIFRKV